jgi:RNA polymerase II-associated factor 1
MLDIPIDVQSLGSSAFLSQLVQTQPVNVDIDMDLGMPLDMTQIQGIFDRGDESGTFKIPGGGPQ